MAQAEAPPDFNSRYHCKGRIYKYFFMEDNMNIDKIKNASNYLLGEHDFKNFCKMDVLNTTNHVRTIKEITLEKIS